MPYHKIGPDRYQSASGKVINGKQNKLWHTLGGRWPGETKSEDTMGYAKGGAIRTTSYAAGGPVLGRTRDFMKEPDEFRNKDEANASADEDQLYGKDGEGKGDGVKKLPKNTPKVLKGKK